LIRGEDRRRGSRSSVPSWRPDGGGAGKCPGVEAERGDVRGGALAASQRLGMLAALMASAGS